MFFRRRKLIVWGGAGAAGALAAGVGFWPSDQEQAAYPFARRLAGEREPLWSVAPEQLLRASEDDAKRLERLLLRLDGAVTSLERLEPRLANARTGELSAAEREELRRLWWQVFEPILAVDELKSRYQGWYGLDYVKQAKLHARANAVSFTALCGQVESGFRLLRALEGKRLLPVLFDEAMPSVGLPAHTFSGLRANLGRARDLLLVPLGGEWYERWIARHLSLDAELAPLLVQLKQLRKRALSWVLEPSSLSVENKLDRLKNALFRRWFPLQRGVAEWAGDTRFASQSRRLVNDAQLHALRAELRPGDILLERRNWYLSNVGLPGFWPHAALYVGTQTEILSSLGTAAEVKASVGNLEQHLRKVAPRAWASLAERDSRGHELCVIEAVSEGVVSASVEHSCGADYVAALRPRVGAMTRLRAIERALAFWGRPYDFNFDFATDDQVVCSELVVKAYEPTVAEDQGLVVPYVELVGRRAVPPTEIVRTFRTERGKPSPQLDFVHFLEGREAEHKAVAADADALAATCDRPKWDIVQP